MAEIGQFNKRKTFFPPEQQKKTGAISVTAFSFLFIIVNLNEKKKIHIDFAKVAWLSELAIHFQALKFRYPPEMSHIFQFT